MPQPHQSSIMSVFLSYILIIFVIGSAAAAFTYAAGWLSPRRLTPDRLVHAFSLSTGAPLGHRRNHSKGICFTGVFEANGSGSELSRAQVFTQGQFPVVGRFNLAVADA